MTVLVGVRCTDGVVIGADSAATSAAGNMHLLKLTSDKIVIVGDRVIVAGTGQIGLGQRFADQVKQAHDAKLFQKAPVDVAKALAAMGSTDFASTGATKGSYGALVGAPIEDSGQLIEFATADFQPELKNGKIHFVAMGSGQTLAEPFMSFVDRTFWRNKAPDVKTALFGVHWALSHTIRCAPGFVGDPICLAKLTKGNNGWKAELVSDEVLQEQAEHMAAIEERIAGYRDEMLGLVEAVAVPTP
jgi:Proteasome subunit